MIENTLENKAKFFALHMHQELCIPENPDEGYHPFSHNEKWLFLDGILGNKIVVRRIAERVYDGYNQTRLLLKPLSSITDADAIEVAKILSFHDGKGLLIDRHRLKHGEITMYDRYNDYPLKINTLYFIPETFEMFSKNDNGNWFNYDGERILEIADYLRSKSYLLSWMGLTPDEILNYGWAKYKEV